tara:strand:- start:2202 stop:3209 length:1008 start_codon:yes stop_codon:yes gene_type:complete
MKATSMTAKMMMTKALEQSYIEFGRQLIESLSNKYGFDAEEALKTMELEVKKEGEKRQKKESNIEIPKFPLPFCNKINDACCHGIRPNHGLYTQCTNVPLEGHSYCKTCNKHAETSADGKPKNGDIKDRMDNTDWRSPDGKTPKNYGNIMKKLNITREKAEEEAGKFGWIIDESQYDQKKGKAGRPKSPATTDTDEEKPKKRGRPAKKQKKTISQDAGDDVIAKLMSQINLDEDDISSDESNTNDDANIDEDDELASQPDMTESVISKPNKDIVCDDEEEELPSCIEFTFKDTKYYKDTKTNILYEYGDIEEELDIIGVFNENKQCIEPYVDDEE